MTIESFRVPAASVLLNGEITGENAGWRAVFRTKTVGCSLCELITFGPSLDESHGLAFAKTCGFLAPHCQKVTRTAPDPELMQALIISDDDPDRLIIFLFCLTRRFESLPMPPDVGPVMENAVEQGMRASGAAALHDGDCVVLTEREEQVVALLARGCTSADVSKHLGIAQPTVHTHIRNAMRKVGSTNRTGLVATALAEGWIRG